MESISGQFYLNPPTAGPFWPTHWHRGDFVCVVLIIRISSARTQRQPNPPPRSARPGAIKISHSLGADSTCKSAFVSVLVVARTPQGCPQGPGKIILLRGLKRPTPAAATGKRRQRGAVYSVPVCVTERQVNRAPSVGDTGRGREGTDHCFSEDER